ncbi:MAG: hypothetical protein GF317_16975 [Candidatus Lokiarchaeota archaeon]|nr:hypothetical protein [Candidatus Lokiarchaeota archaeon]MBD3201212.1 hypothetical protein [Candidatus Lokiarchaeota archaeon]
MTSDNISYQINLIIEKKLADLKLKANNFHKIPPIIGVIVADQYGNTILIFEYDEKDKNYNPIKSYLSGNNANLIEVDLISMYFSSFKTFASQTNIQNLSNLEINGSNIKSQIYFMKDHIIIVFLNSNTLLKKNEKKLILDYLYEILEKYNKELLDFNTSNSREIFKMLEYKGRNWLSHFNNKFIENQMKVILRNYEDLERIMKEIKSILKLEINEYLENISEEIVTDLSREIESKIQDKLIDILSENQSEDLSK